MAILNYTTTIDSEKSILEIQKDPKVPRSKCTDEQALRVSWRIIKDWVKAQMAIVECQRECQC